MKAYFNRNVPFYVLGPEEIDDSVGFDSYVVDVPVETVEFAQSARAITKKMTQLFDVLPAPEECAQQSADALSGLVQDTLVSIMGTPDGEE